MKTRRGVHAVIRIKFRWVKYLCINELFTLWLFKMSQISFHPLILASLGQVHPINLLDSQKCYISVLNRICFPKKCTNVSRLRRLLRSSLNSVVTWHPAPTLNTMFPITRRLTSLQPALLTSVIHTLPLFGKLTSHFPVRRKQWESTARPHTVNQHIIVSEENHLTGPDLYSHKVKKGKGTASTVGSQEFPHRLAYSCQAVTPRWRSRRTPWSNVCEPKLETRTWKAKYSQSFGNDSRSL